MLRTLFFVGLGSCLGGIGRYLLQQLVQRHLPSIMPWGTLSVNIIGCFAIGIVYALAARGNLLSPEMRLLLATGICGGFTTFSSFAYENAALVLSREYAFSIAYIALSVALGFGAVYAGIGFVRLLFNP